MRFFQTTIVIIISSALGAAISIAIFAYSMKLPDLKYLSTTKVDEKTRPQEINKIKREERGQLLTTQLESIEERLIAIETRLVDLSNHSDFDGHEHSQNDPQMSAMEKARNRMLKSRSETENNVSDDWFFSIDEGGSEYPISTSALPPSVTDSECRGSYCRVEISEQLLEVAKSEYWNEMSPLERKLEMMSELTSGLEGVKLTEGKTQGGSAIFYISRPDNKTSP